MSQHQTYNEALLSALDCLEDSEGHAMSAVLNIALARPYKELGRLHEVGEIFEVVPDMFRDTGDNNIDMVLKVVDSIIELKETIRNLNAL